MEGGSNPKTESCKALVLRKAGKSETSNVSDQRGLVVSEALVTGV